MAIPLLKTKLYIPPIRSELVSRPRLIKWLNAGLTHKLTLISTPAGFGKTTLLSEWVGGCGQPVAWVSLDGGDNDPAHFLAYLVAALQTVGADVGEDALNVLQSPGFVQTPPVDTDTPPVMEMLITTLINQISTIPDFVLVLDDYHLITAQPIHDALAFLLDHLPDNMHLVIATRADPPLPIACLRGRGQLTELRLAELRFTFDQAAVFFHQVMDLELSTDDVAALASRTEGWIAGTNGDSLDPRAGERGEFHSGLHRQRPVHPGLFGRTSPSAPAWSHWQVACKCTS